MHLPSFTQVLAYAALGAGLAHSLAVPADIDLTEKEPETHGLEKRRQIDWKIVRGGLEIGRDVIIVASGATSAIAAVVGWWARDNAANSCDPIGGQGQSNDGSQTYNFKYWVTTTGKNCDTTAQVKTISAALDDAWDDVHKKQYNWACLDLSHGGTWHGHLAVATTESGMDVNTMCS